MNLPPTYDMPPSHPRALVLTGLVLRVIGVAYLLEGSAGPSEDLTATHCGE